MSDAIVVLLNGEVLVGSYQSTIQEQKSKAMALADKLLPIFVSDLNVVVMHGNKPQVGYVLFRSEIASHVLHQVPLDVCGADTQGATGYMLSQSITNALRINKSKRKVMPIVTQTVINSDSKYYEEKNKQIGPWLDRGTAEQRRQAYGWSIIEEPGYGYRRVVSSPPAIEIVEIEGIRQLVQSGMIVVAAGGGGIPVIENKDGLLNGVEAVVDTDQVASMLAQQLNAKIILVVVGDAFKFISAGIELDTYMHISRSELEAILNKQNISSSMVMRTLHSANNHLQNNGCQAVITTLDNLHLTLKKESGLWIYDSDPEIDLSEMI